MTRSTNVERILDAYLAPEDDRLPDRVIGAALAEIARTPQRRAMRMPWRIPPMQGLPRSAALLVALVAIVGASAIYLGIGLRGPNQPSEPAATPTTTPASSAAPSGPLDTSAWTPFVSAHYGYTIGVPPGWSVTPAARTWTWDRDGTNWLSPAVDAFVSPGSTIRVSAWTVPLDGQAIESWADVEAWASDYCTRAHDAPCTGIHDRVVPMCIETRDCHPALIVPFKDDVIFFGTGGVLPPGMTVVAVWRGESDPSTAPFGGSRPLLEAFLSTMGVFPPRYGESQGAAATFMATGR